MISVEQVYYLFRLFIIVPIPFLLYSSKDNQL